MAISYNGGSSTQYFMDAVKYTDENNVVQDVKCIKYNNEVVWSKPIAILYNDVNDAGRGEGTIVAGDLSEPAPSKTAAIGRTSSFKTYTYAQGFWGDSVSIWSYPKPEDGYTITFNQSSLYYYNKNRYVASETINNQNVSFDINRSDITFDTIKFMTEYIRTENTVNMKIDTSAYLNKGYITTYYKETDAESEEEKSFSGSGTKQFSRLYHSNTTSARYIYNVVVGTYSTRTVFDRNMNGVFSSQTYTASKGQSSIVAKCFQTVTSISTDVEFDIQVPASTGVIGSTVSFNWDDDVIAFASTYSIVDNGGAKISNIGDTSFRYTCSTATTIRLKIPVRFSLTCSVS